MVAPPGRPAAGERPSENVDLCRFAPSVDRLVDEDRRLRLHGTGTGLFHKPSGGLGPAAVRIHDGAMATREIDNQSLFGLIALGLGALVLVAVMVTLMWRATPG